MDTTYNNPSQTIALSHSNEAKWSAIDLMVLMALAMYVFSSLAPQAVGNCSQRVSSNTVVTTVESAAA